ncbi:MAG: branched-chain amino acid ABC transporter permease [Desulfobacterales bacterium]|jgi:branched-chain amino acid transport system permease protein
MSFGPHLFLALLEGTVTAFVLALIALGLSLVFGVMRIVNIAHGEFFMLGAVLAWACSMLVGGGALMGFAVALVVGPLIVGAMAVAADGLILRRINYQPESTIVATIGLLYIIQQLVLTLFGADARPVTPPIYFRVAFPWFGYSGYKLIVAGVSGLLLLGTWLAMSKTKLGLYMRATQQDQEMAQAFGVPVRRVYAKAFALGAMLAAVAGVLVVPIQQAHYLMGLDPLLLSFIVVIIGGLGSLKGTMVAAFVVGISDGVVSVFFSPTLAKIVATLLVAAVLVLRPGGLFGEEGS